ncbi:hypothetical protein MGU_08382 [Metarhizium guizhouense ARSEF 977]|uniref:O-methyltransferase, family 2 n=1 Tax=Metarhizium guizhouense (strain ARSEF 977) TaxID=1276136 RepID=A0A0B4GC21_METGA|nr:hypothetical protein MGU_08382 [Metarhizium guizhouense ARSEF 977]
MDSIANLVSCAAATTADVEALVAMCRVQCPGDADESIKVHTILQDGPAEVQKLKKSMMANVAHLQQLIMGPSELLQQLACQPAEVLRTSTKVCLLKSQLLACLHWLGHFQVLACIPLRHSVPIKDISDLAGVPEAQLCRIARMTMAFGFLCEPQPGRLSHNALSAAFVTNPSLLDAVMFLAGIATPSALKMAANTQRLNYSSSPQATAYNLASNHASSFSTECEQRPQLRRQWSAFRRYGTGDVDDDLVEILQSLQCANQFVGKPGTVVEIGAESTTQAMALASHYPCLKIIVQMGDLEAQWQNSGGKNISYDSMLDQPGCIVDGRVTIQRRPMGTTQTIRDATVYILHLTSCTGVAEGVHAELKQLVEVLKNNRSGRIVLTSGLLPELGTVRRSVEALARLRDLTMFQLANQRELEMAEMMSILNSMGDNTGRLIVENKYCSPTSGASALEIRYHEYATG